MSSSECISGTEIAYGETCTFSCPDGYVLEEGLPQDVSCQGYGDLSGPIPSCRGICAIRSGLETCIATHTLHT